MQVVECHLLLLTIGTMEVLSKKKVSNSSLMDFNRTINYKSFHRNIWVRITRQTTIESP
jgi:hypothetical protein